MGIIQPSALAGLDTGVMDEVKKLMAHHIHGIGAVGQQGIAVNLDGRIFFLNQLLGEEITQDGGGQYKDPI